MSLNIQRMASVNIAMETDSIDSFEDNKVKTVENRQMKLVITKARIAFSQNISRDVNFRKKQLKGLLKCVDENKELFCNALMRDLRKSQFESVVTEIEFARNEILTQLYDIDENVKPKPVSKSAVVMMDDAFIQHEPYGVVLIIGPWNYPIQLALAPLAGAIAAGNCVILKPSEVASASADVMAKVLPRYIDNDCYHVVLGGVEETQAILKEKFDYIFFTGSTSVGRIVHAAAAKHMTPTTLELGGKSPVYIDETIPNVEMALKRILWGKLMNSGQTCVAPDYVLCTQQVQQKLLENSAKIIKELYGDDPKSSPDYCRIINDKNFQRINNLINSSGKPIIGGDTDASQRYIAPTIFANVKPDDPIMQEEIFGPVLPFVTVKDAQHAIDFINRGDKPLAMYLFSTKKDVINKFINETSSGGICANDTIFHLLVDTLPFGGIGASGMGAYHGKYSFETFSHAKPVLIRGFNPILESIGSIRYPPFTKSNMNALIMAAKKRQNLLPKNMKSFVMFSMGFFTAFIILYYDCFGINK